MIKAASADRTATPPDIIVIQHFDEELKRLVPSKEARFIGSGQGHHRLRRF